MPHWLIYHPPNAYADGQSKDILAKAITDIYKGKGLPAFYVVVNFIEVPQNSFYIGAAKRDLSDKPFIRLVGTHIAHNYPDDGAIRAAGELFNQVLTPFMKEKGYDWEFHIVESDRRLWRTNEFIPPERHTEAEKTWVKENRPVPY